MFDVNFYMRATEWLDAGGFVYGPLEDMRSRQPFLYNCESTSFCPFSCVMCPRTTLMKRKPSTMSMSTFRRVVDQLRPHDPETWAKWQDWCARRFGVHSAAPPSENHFFLHVIPRVIQLHGYGEPLVDKRMPERIGYMTERGLESYFSCNPAVLDDTRFVEHMRAGLSVVKFSIESTDDERFKQIRGARANFTESFRMIKSLLAERDRRGWKTMFVVTMLDLGEPDRAWEFAKLRDALKGLPIYSFLKSEDSQWLRTEGVHENKSLHWTRPCLHPWMSMTVLADGSVQMCMECYDRESGVQAEYCNDLGNVNDASLADIWNSDAYARLRRAHLTGEGLPEKCVSRCDMPTVGGLRG